MTTIDFTPLYRSTVGFDGLADLFDFATRSNQNSSYPPYNIESHGEENYSITLAVAGFSEDEIDINVENQIMTIKGKKNLDENTETNYLYQGIATRSFEKKFNLAEYVEVTNANLVNGLLTIKLKKELPEAMKPKSIKITSVDNASKQKKLSVA